MKNIVAVIVLFISCIFLPGELYSQWYGSNGVLNYNDLTQPQLELAWHKAQKIEDVGVGGTIVGAILAGVGGIFYYNSLSNMLDGGISQLGKNYSDAITGAYIMGGGIAVVGIGISLWIVGAMRKSDIEIALAKFSSKVSLQPILFNLKSSSDLGYGLSLAIRF
jgi:hypothetical protein